MPVTGDEFNGISGFIRELEADIYRIGGKYGRRNALFVDVPGVSRLRR